MQSGGQVMPGIVLCVLALAASFLSAPLSAANALAAVDGGECESGMACARTHYQFARKSRDYISLDKGLRKAYDMAAHGCSGVLLGLFRLQKADYEETDADFVQSAIENARANFRVREHDLEQCFYYGHNGKDLVDFVASLNAVRSRIHQMAPNEIHNAIARHVIKSNNDRYRQHGLIFFANYGLIDFIMNLPDERINDDIRFLQYKIANSEAYTSRHQRDNREHFRKYAQLSDQLGARLADSSHRGYVEYRLKFIKFARFAAGVGPADWRTGVKEEEDVLIRKGLALKIPYVLENQSHLVVRDYLRTRDPGKREEAMEILLAAKKQGINVDQWLLALSNPDEYERQGQIRGAEADRRMLSSFQQANQNKEKRIALVEQGNIKTQADVDFVCRTRGLSTRRGVVDSKEEYYCEQARLQLANRNQPRPAAGGGEPAYKTTFGGHTQQTESAYRRAEERSTENNRRRVEAIREAERLRQENQNRR